MAVRHSGSAHTGGIVSRLHADARTLRYRGVDAVFNAIKHIVRETSNSRPVDLFEAGVVLANAFGVLRFPA